MDDIRRIEEETKQALDEVSIFLTCMALCNFFKATSLRRSATGM